MAVNIKEFIAAGFDSGWYTILDTSGYAGGVSGAVTSGAAGEAAGFLKGVQTADLNIVEPETVPVPGEDSVIGQFIFPPDQLPSFTIEAGAINYNDVNRFQGTSSEDIGDMTITPLQPENPVYADTAFLFTRRNKSKAAASDGVGGYEHLVIPKANAVPLGAFPLTGRTAASGRYRVSVGSNQQKFATGATYFNAVAGTTGAAITAITSENPMTWHTFVGTGAVTVFGPLEKTPASTSLNKVHVYKDGLRMTTGVTINTTTRELTFSVAPASNSKIVVFYEYSR